MNQAGATVQRLRMDVGSTVLTGNLTVPPGATGLVLFAHGSGSGRLSPRNRFVAERVQEAHLGTLLFDLLDPEEEAADRVDAHIRFDIPFLAQRLLAATDALRAETDLADLPTGYFGSSTGGAAALVAAAQRPDQVDAVVSRGGRPDLAEDHLPQVTCPVLLIVGGADREVLRLNAEAKEAMRCPVTLDVVPGATHLFEEPGTLDAVASTAARWFADRLTADRPR